MKIIDLIKLLRPHQWYKNLVIFAVILFSGNLLNLDYLVLTFFGFISLILISSVNYIINDIVDIKKDKLHPEKALRPLASGKVKIWHALIIAPILLIGSLIIAYNLSLYFFFAVIFLFAFTQLYSFFLKKEAFADIISISINFIARAAAGAFIINVYISAWLVLVIFFLSLFLTLGKRKADMSYLGKHAAKHKASLKKYSENMINFLLIIVTSALVISYSLYCIIGGNHLMLFTLPIVLYALFRYAYLIYSGSPVARRPHKIFKDIRMVISIILWLIITSVVLYSSLTLNHLLP